MVQLAYQQPIPVECPAGHPRQGWATETGVTGWCPPPCVGRFTWDPTTGTASTDLDQPEPPPEPGDHDWVVDGPAWQTFHTDLETFDELAERTDPEDLE